MDQFHGSGIMSGVKAIYFYQHDGIIQLLIQKQKVLLGPWWSLALTCHIYSATSQAIFTQILTQRVLRKKTVQHVWLTAMGTDIIDLHGKNEMIHFSNEIVTIVITCGLLDIFVVCPTVDYTVANRSTRNSAAFRAIGY